MSFFATSDAKPEWVNGLPDDWTSDWLKWSATLSTERPNDEEKELLPYISNEHIESWTGKLMIGNAEPSESDGRKFSTDDVLFNKLRPYLAKVYQAEFDGVSSGELLCLRPSNRLDSRFLFHVVSSKLFVDAVNLETFGSKMPRADWEIVGHQPLPLPPINIQKQIAAFLDEKTAQIDGLIEKKRALLDRLAEKRQALITKAVTKGLDPNVPIKDSGIDWLGHVPEHWEVLPIRRLTKAVGTGRTPPSDSGDYFSEREVEWYTPGDFVGRLELGTSKRYITQQAIDDKVANLYPPNTLMLVGIGATLGKVSVTKVAASANQQINAIQFLPQHTPYFFANALTAFRDEVRMTSNGNTLGILNQDGTKSLVLPVPPANEQIEIVTLLRGAEKNDLSIRGRISDSIVLLEEYRAALISSAVTGKIEGLQ